METVAYQLYDESTGWKGYYIWLRKEFAEEQANQMNKDRKENGLSMSISVREVSIINLPF